MPTGILLKQYQPKGVMKVVSNCDSLASRICHYPLLATNFENIVAPASKAKVSSTHGRGWTSRNTLSFSFFISTQILIAPDYFGTATIPAHQGVGSSTLEIGTTTQTF